MIQLYYCIRSNVGIAWPQATSMWKSPEKKSEILYASPSSVYIAHSRLDFFEKHRIQSAETGAQDGWDRSHDCVIPYTCRLFSAFWSFRWMDCCLFISKIFQSLNRCRFCHLQIVVLWNAGRQFLLALLPISRDAKYKSSRYIVIRLETNFGSNGQRTYRQ